jgi:hypothetical protein
MKCSREEYFQALVADFSAFGLIWRIFLDFCSWPAWPPGNWPLTRPGSRNPSPSHRSGCSRSSPAEEQSEKKVVRKIKCIMQMLDRLFSLSKPNQILTCIHTAPHHTAPYTYSLVLKENKKIC